MQRKPRFKVKANAKNLKIKTNFRKITKQIKKNREGLLNIRRNINSVSPRDRNFSPIKFVNNTFFNQNRLAPPVFQKKTKNEVSLSKFIYWI